MAANGLIGINSANEGLTERAGAGDVYDAFCTHLLSSPRCRVSCLHCYGAHCTDGKAGKASLPGSRVPYSLPWHGLTLAMGPPRKTHGRSMDDIPYLTPLVVAVY